MAPLRTQDHALFTGTELALIQSSSSSAIKELSLPRIKSSVTRARRYGDKYRDLARQQHRTKKRDSGKGQAQPFPNIRTERKARLFAEALTRFEKRQTQLEKQEEKKKAKKNSRKGPGSRTASRTPATAKETIRRKNQRRQAKSQSAQESKIAQQFQKKKSKAIQGHIRARGKRTQAKRDRR
jgi:hypothetical protein